MKQKRLNMPVVLVLALVWAVSAKAGVLVDPDWLNAHMNDPNDV